MSIKNPHPFNPQFEKHPDYAIEILESVASQSVREKVKDLQRTFNVEIDFIFTAQNEQGKTSKFPLTYDDMGASYMFLPVLLSLDVQRTYRLLFPDTNYPIGLCPMSEGSMFGTYPIIKNLSHFPAITLILNYEIEKMIDKEFARTIYELDFFNIAVPELRRDTEVQRILMECIAEENIKKVELDMTDYINKYEQIVIKSRNNEVMDYYPPEITEDRRYSLEDVMDIFHQQRQYLDVKSIWMGNELDLQTFIKPEFPSKVRYEEFLKQEKIRSNRMFNHGVVTGGQQNVF